MLMFLFAGGNGQVKRTFTVPAKVMLVLSIGRGVAEGTLAGSVRPTGILKFQLRTLSDFFKHEQSFSSSPPKFTKSKKLKTQTQESSFSL